MNDVSILVPLPASFDTPTLLTIVGDGSAPLVPRDRFFPLVVDPGDIGPKLGGPIVYENFHVVAVRFDLCLHDAPFPCRSDEDGRVRLVLQPLALAIDGTITTQDIAIHAFYPIPRDELAEVVGELRALARLQDASIDSPLMPSPALTAAPAGEYAARMRALILEYASASTLVRLTVLGQNKESAAFAWIMRGVHRGDAGWSEIRIPEVREFKQSVLLGGGDTVYDARPAADSPPGFAFALDGSRFAAATPDEQRASLEALATVQNPTMRGAGDTQCLACHVSTFLLRRRAEVAGIDPTALIAHFDASYNVTVDTVASTDPRVVRAFGWVGARPAISQRVAYDTAVSLSEIEQRFPTTTNR